MVKVNGQRILVTGATGFVGQRLCTVLQSMGAVVVKTSRFPSREENTVQVAPLGPATDWRHALKGCTGVVHLAARVHVMNDNAPDPMQEFRLANTEGTLQLARQAAQAGVKRMVFVSSIKVNGEAGDFTADSIPNPLDPYGVSKFEAEQQLLQFGKQSGLEVVVLRPPLVYGPGVRANFLKLLSVVARGVPLPFGAIRNKRSLLFVGNLASATVACLQHPDAAGKVFLVSDNSDVSTAQLVQEMALALGRKASLVNVPPALIEFMAALLGKRAAAQRVLGNLTVSPKALCEELEWQPPFSMRAGLKETADWYMKQGQLKIND